ncbi:MAG: DUF1937 family protein [Pirellulaceae bacterium]
MIYLASPYTHNNPAVRRRRFEQACQATASLLRAGISTFSPVVHSHPVTKFGLPSTWEFWSRLDREFLARSDVLAVLTLPGWRDSVGVTAEIEMARSMGLPVVYVAPDEFESGSDAPSLAELRKS